MTDRHPATRGDRTGVAVESPRPHTVWRAVGMRAVLPMLGLLAANLLIGLLITGPLGGLTGESAINAALQTYRNAGLDSFARLISFLGSTTGNLVLVAVVLVATWLISRRWWVALVPALALLIEAGVHFATTTLINRQRPTVPQLDVAQPTMSFPSGHIGATLAQLLILILFARALRAHAVRVLLWVVLVAFIGALFFSRLYLGMHHLSDCLVGVANGIASAFIAWHYLPLDEGGSFWRHDRTPSVR